MNGPIPGGLLVAVEGIDGAGKTTLAEALGERLRSYGNLVTVSKEPTRGPWGSKLRESAHRGRLTVEQEIELLRLDREQHCSEVIEPALSRGEIVILDRYYYSTAAYQGAAGADVAAIIRNNIAFAPTPDVTLLLDLPVAIGIARIVARGDVPNKFESSETLEICRAIFNSLRLSEIVAIDATKSAVEVESLAWAHVARNAAKKLVQEHGLSVMAGEALLKFGTRA